MSDEFPLEFNQDMFMDWFEGLEDIETSLKDWLETNKSHRSRDQIRRVYLLARFMKLKQVELLRSYGISKNE